MRIWSFAKGRHIAGVFRLCLAVIVSLTLGVGSIALNTQPVRADITISQPSPCPYTMYVKPCLPGTLQLQWTGTGYGSGCTVDDHMWWIQGVPNLQNQHSYFTYNYKTGLISYRFCQEDTNKDYTFTVYVYEHSPNC